MSQRPIKNNKGQIVLEYVLLVVIAVTISAMLIKQLVSRGDQKGVLILKLCEIHRLIGSDIPDLPDTPNDNLSRGCPK